MIFHYNKNTISRFRERNEYEENDEGSFSFIFVARNVSI